MASNKAQEILDEIKVKVNIDSKEELRKIVKTAIISKNISGDETLLNLIVDAIKYVKSVENKDQVDIDSIKIEKKVGGGLSDSKLIKGILIEKEKVHPDMPDEIKNAKIALLNLALEIEKTNIDAQLRIEKPDQLQAFLGEEEKILKDMVDKIKASGANVIVCQKGIDDAAQYFLSKAKILAFRRVSEGDMKKIGKATGAKVVSTLTELEPNALGEAGYVHAEKIGNEDVAIIEECKNPKSVTLLIRGGTEHVVDEAKRAVEDSLGDLKVLIESGGSVVAGGGACEMEVSRRLKEFAATLEGREQLAVDAFADSLEIVPKTLAENAGMDPIDILVDLRAAHKKGNIWSGVDLSNIAEPIVADMFKAGVLEPVNIKKQAIKSSSEVAIMILKIDDIIAAGKSANQSAQPPSGGYGGGYGE